MYWNMGIWVVMICWCFSNDVILVCCDILIWCMLLCYFFVVFDMCFLWELDIVIRLIVLDNFLLLLFGLVIV